MKAVLFDLDGTLLNRDASVHAFIENQYDRLNNGLKHIPKETYCSRFIELDKRGYVWKDRVYQQLLAEFELSDLKWEDMLEDYISEFKHHCVPFNGLKEMLKELKSMNILVGMITNGYGQFQMDNIEALGIKEFFDVILVSEWEGMKKPNQEIFHRALERLNVASAESIFVGDHRDNDVYAAQQAGMKAIWKIDSEWDQVDADFIVENLLEIPTIIELLRKDTVPAQSIVPNK
ncbi:HAD family hydrolase [Alkalihalophilus marmarensis]|jgi:putative hydrolase of the HAD superfamily|uniref:HAD family hydrolase n=1 Tax=Alkalihalophilus marmarensis TaxID=521377 RepID=UPI002041695F|nr:HAD family hydrolase [Alkalihalophilus marmarensis]MCM3490144.1 HAD family hydrolase [Alkalihalophilus marmarensis]